MDGLFVDHFQQFVVILYGNMPAIDVGMELFKAEEEWQILPLNVHIGSQ